MAAAGRSGYRGRHVRAPRRQPAALVASCLFIAGLLHLPQASAAFTAMTTNGGNAFGAGPLFKTYPDTVSADGPAFHHRSDETPDFGPTAVAADASSHNRAGTYAGATDGPVTSWRFSEGSGTGVADSSGGANPGTLTNGAAFGAGPTDGGATLDGSNDYVAGARPAVRTDTSFTVTAWVNLTATGGVRAAVSQDGAVVSAFFLKADPYVNRWVFELPPADATGGTWAKVNSSVLPVAGEWTHLAGVYDDAGDEIRIYVDGVLSGRATRTVDWDATGPFVAGRALYAGSHVDRWYGGLDDVRAYPRALDASEVASVYGNPSTQWEAEENTGTSTTDLSGNGNTGTLAAGATWTTSGYAGNALLLDGVDDHVVGAAAVPRTSRSFTAAAWVYLTATGANRTVFSAPGTVGTAFALRYNSAGKWEALGTDTDAASPATTTAQSQTAAAANTWVHLTLVYDDPADQLRLYVNGTQEAAATRTADWAAGVSTVGRARYNSVQTEHWAGRIDAFRTYAHALTGPDVTHLYEAPTVAYEFDESSGTTAVDASGNRNTGTLSSATARTSVGYAGSAASLNGTDQFVSGARRAVATDSSFSVSAWVYLTATGSNRTAVSQDGAAVSGFWLQYDHTVGRWAFAMNNGDSTATGGLHARSTTVPVLGRWTHLVGVYDDPNDQLRLYVNGALEATTARSVEWASSGSVVVGAAKWTSRDEYWPGRIDAVAAYGRVLSTTDVADLHAEFPSTTYTFEESTSGTVPDVSGHGNTGTFTNAGLAGAGNGLNGSNGVGLNGTSAYVTAAAVPVATNSAFTVSAWVWFNNNAASRTVLSQRGTNTSAFQLRYDQPSDRWQFVMTRSDVASPVQDVVTSAAAPPVGRWYHLVGVYDEYTARARLYVNGSEQGSAAHTTAWNATGGFVVGRAWLAGAGAEYYLGTADEVRAFRRVLTPIEVLRLYTGYAVPVVPAVSHVPTMSAGVIGALQGAQQGQRSSNAVAFNGAGSGTSASNDLAVSNPTVFSLEFWFRATGTRGGVLMGFYQNRTGASGSRDRQVYLDSAGRLTFGTYPGASALTVRSPAAYNDGAWHHVVASLGPAGLRLHVDGEPVARDSAVTTAGNFTGYWRWGGGDTGNWPNRPANDAFTGTIDEVAVYYTQLAEQQVRWHYHANH